MRRIFVTIIFVIVLSGCGQKNPYDTVYVDGTVTLDGVPIANANVIFAPLGNGNTAGGLTDASGKYKLTTGGAPVGSGAIPDDYDVTFFKAEIEGANLTEEEYEKQIGNRMPKNIYIIPEKYTDTATSGITPVKVEKGKKNTFNFNLTTKE
ncbi:MAG: carboxypeptidase-like regulatory domain-containing protein [Planctomycetaceae bacterium]|nr:carboxypeptidase-like regulatory domain-containing protein [Planctomycetaceae bacterium]